MNRGVLQNSSPVQPPMMAGGNPTWWWNINGTPSTPPLPPPAPPVSLGGLSSSSIIPDHRCVPTASDHQVKQENSASSYNHMYGPPNNDQQDFHLGFAAKPLSRSWSSTALLSSPAGSCDTATETTSVRSFSKNNKPGTRNPPRDRPYECNSKANGGAHKKARVQPSSAQSTIKVRKEKLGDRIAALHQLVSPFGKTDTASVLSEAIGYIRFLQSQIYVSMDKFFCFPSWDFWHISYYPPQCFHRLTPLL
ncbi:hypothetical protein SAY87_005616 [Trapa incisa]|uniref:BHLH domain-containing protein n=1 Tax=Trapa incisa TaxID=236973 RepID=A0AAN7K358_9MYRT|nr:hypothetical protein SAY87_005616 [Trapa incisa]